MAYTMLARGISMDADKPADGGVCPALCAPAMAEVVLDSNMLLRTGSRA